MKRVPITLVVEVEEWDGHFERAPSYTARILASWQSDDEVFNPEQAIGPQSDSHSRPDSAIRQALASLNPQKLVST